MRRLDERVRRLGEWYEEEDGSSRRDDRRGTVGSSCAIGPRLEPCGSSIRTTLSLGGLEEDAGSEVEMEAGRFVFLCVGARVRGRSSL